MGYIYDNETGEFRPTGNTSHNNTSSGGYVYDDETGEYEVKKGCVSKIEK